MVNGLFKEISEEEIMSVNGGCGGSGGLPNSDDSETSKPSIKQIIVEAVQSYVKYCSWKYYPEINGW